MTGSRAGGQDVVTPLLQHKAAGLTFSEDVSQLFNLLSWLLQVFLL